VIAENILQQAQTADRDRLLRISRAWDAYYGKLPKPLKVKPGDQDDNVRLNYSGLIVDIGVSFLFGQMLDFEVTKPKGAGQGEASSEPSPADKWLCDCWDANKRMTTLTKLAINGGVCGHTFVKVKQAQAAKGQKFPRLIVLDPATVTALWSPEDFEEVEAYVIQWNAVDPITQKPMVRRQIIEPADAGMRWTITDYVSKGNARSWDFLSETLWPYPWSPIFHCQNLPAPNEFYGRADLDDDVVEANTSINFNVSNISRILKIHAHPKTWGNGFEAKTLDMSVDNLIVLPDPEAKLQNLEMQSDLSSSLEFYTKLKEALHEIAQIPEVATGKMDKIGALSGVALEILFKPIVQKTGKKQLTYGDMLADLNGRLLELGGTPTSGGFTPGGKGEGQKVSAHWPNVIPVNTKEDAETGTIYDTLGVSRETILTRLGFDAALEQKKRAAQDTDEADQAADAAGKMNDATQPDVSGQRKAA
jgi:hypothetical protein